jgi:hypothetical protein
MIALICWVLCGVWGYQILKDKGHNPIIGACLGGILGLIGIIICYLFFDDKFDY